MCLNDQSMCCVKEQAWCTAWLCTHPAVCKQTAWACTSALGGDMGCVGPHPQGKARPTELMKVGSTLYRRMAQLSLQQTTAAMMRAGGKPGTGGAGGAAAVSDTDGPQSDESGPALELKGRSPSSGQEVRAGAGWAGLGGAGHGMAWHPPVCNGAALAGRQQHVYRRCSCLGWCCS